MNLSPRYANFFTDEPMCECLGISDGSARTRRDAGLDEWTMAALRQNMSIVACDPESGGLLGEEKSVDVDHSFMWVL